MVINNYKNEFQDEIELRTEGLGYRFNNIYGDRRSSLFKNRGKNFEYEKAKVFIDTEMSSSSGEEDDYQERARNKDCLR